MANQISHLDHIFGALSDPTRRSIVMRLCQGEASVGELAKPFDMALPSLLKHIQILESGGLISSKKDGRIRKCSLRIEALASTEGWPTGQRKIWEQRLDQLETYVERMKEKEENENVSKSSSK